MAKNILKPVRRLADLPQISRILTAPLGKLGGKILFLGLISAFLCINLFPGLPPDFFAFEQAKLAVMLYPEDLSSHLLLAQEYLRRGNLNEVEQELLLAQGFAENNSTISSNSPTVLGAALSPLKILQKIKNEPQRIRQEISFWEKQVLDKPDYRDAYLQLAILNYQIYENEKAKGYLQKALELDPNFEPTKELEIIIKE